MENKESLKKQEKLEAEARKRVSEIKDFYIHLIVYIVVNFCIFLLNVITSPNTLWFFWVIFGWGIGIVSHAISVFGIPGILGKDWEEKKIKQFIDKNK